MVNFPRKQSILTMYLVYQTVKQEVKIFHDVKGLSLEKPTSKDAFLAVCKVLSSDKGLREIVSECENGGLIGPSNGRLHSFPQNFKFFCVDAFHDSFGFMKPQNNLGPGYVYPPGEKPFFKNCCLLGYLVTLRGCRLGFISN